VETVFIDEVTELVLTAFLNTARAEFEVFRVRIAVLDFFSVLVAVVLSGVEAICVHGNVYFGDHLFDRTDVERFFRVASVELARVKDLTLRDLRGNVGQKGLVVTLQVDE
jgi:hypothetical protein